MEYNKINNLLLSEDNESEKLSKFVTREYVRVNSLSNMYNENKSIRFKTTMLRSNLCDYSDAYILVKGTITVMAPGVNNANNIRDKRNRPVILKNNAPFVSCITRINGELIEDADDLDIVMSMYNLLEYSKNYRKTIGSLYNYYRDELSDDADDNKFDNIKVVNSNTFKYKNKIIGNTYDVDATIPNPDPATAAANPRVANPNYNVNENGKKEIELAILLKYLGNFWRALNIPLISCEVSLELKWYKNCVITSLEQRDIRGGNRDNPPTGATLSITDCKLYVPAVTLSKADETNLNISILNIYLKIKKIINLLDKIDTDSKHFATKKWYIINDENNTNYGVNKDTGADNPDTIKYNTRVLKPNLCDYAEAYILIDGTIRAAAANANTRLALKKCAPFTKCNLEINDEHVDTAENLDITMPMYNLIEYSDNYQDSSATLYQYK